MKFSISSHKVRFGFLAAAAVFAAAAPLFAGGAKDAAPDPFASSIQTTREAEYSIDTNKLDSLFIIAEECSISISSSDSIPVPERLTSKKTYERSEDAFIVQVKTSFTGFAPTQAASSAIVNKAVKANFVAKSGSSIIIDLSFAKSFYNEAGGEKLAAVLTVLVPENKDMQYAVKNTAGGITLTKLSGDFQIINKQGKVQLESCSVTKGIQAQGGSTSFTLKNISLKNAQALSVISKEGMIELSAAKDFDYKGNISAKKEEGGYTYSADGTPSILLKSEKTKKPFKVKL